MWRVGRVWRSSGIRWNSETDQMMKTIVSSNKNYVVCNGHSCWAEWTKEICATTTDLMSAEILAYRKCSL